MPDTIWIGNDGCPHRSSSSTCIEAEGVARDRPRRTKPFRTAERAEDGLHCRNHRVACHSLQMMNSEAAAGCICQVWPRSGRKLLGESLDAPQILHERAVGLVLGLVGQTQQVRGMDGDEARIRFGEIGRATRPGDRNRLAGEC